MRSDRTQTKKPQATTLIAPKMAVRSRSLDPPPTSSLKYCGPKYANAVAPVACCAVNTAKAVKIRLKLSGSKNSTMRKLILVIGTWKKASNAR